MVPPKLGARLPLRSLAALPLPSFSLSLSRAFPLPPLLCLSIALCCSSVLSRILIHLRNVSNNSIHGVIPLFLPPSATHINLAFNRLRQNILFSLASLKSLRYLCLIVTICEVVSPALEMEIKTEIKREETGIVLKPKQEKITKSAAQIKQKASPSPVRAIKAYFIHEKMRIVGLTGGIASGKSTVSNLFKANGIPVVDADIIARDVVRKGTSGWKRVVATFGDEILLENGEIDRARLGQIVFADPAKRQLLNRLLAPFISSGIFWEVVKLWLKGSKVIILDIPLLFEAKMDQWAKPIIVVWVDPKTQLQRLMARDGISEEQARNRINAQIALDWKRTKADIVIDNLGSIDETREQFQKVLTEVMRSLTWREFGLSRKGALLVLVSVIIGVMMCRNIYKGNDIKPH